MEKWLEDIMPILGIEHNCILSKQGDITIGFRAELPEIFTLSAEEYEEIHQAWIKAIKILPKHSTLCKQDWFITKRIELETQKDKEKGFLERSADKHFEGRPYLDHSCYIYLTKKPVGRKLSSSMFSNLIRSSIVPEQTLNGAMLSDFEDIAGQFRQILEDTGLIKLSRITDEQFLSTPKETGLLEQYCFLAGQQDPLLIKDFQFDNEGMRIGRQHCQLYTLADAADLPPLCGSRINYDKYSTDKTKFSIGFAGSLGLLLHCNHIYTQYIVIDDSAKTLQKLEKKRLRLQSLSAYSRENLISKDATNDFLNEAISEQRLPVKAHFNILTWSENKGDLKDIRNMVTTAMSQ